MICIWPWSFVTVECHLSHRRLNVSWDDKTQWCLLPLCSWWYYQFPKSEHCLDLAAAHLLLSFALWVFFFFSRWWLFSYQWLILSHFTTFWGILVKVDSVNFCNPNSRDGRFKGWRILENRATLWRRHLTSWH